MPIVAIHGDNVVNHRPQFHQLRNDRLIQVVGVEAQAVALDAEILCRAEHRFGVRFVGPEDVGGEDRDFEAVLGEHFVQGWQLVGRALGMDVTVFLAGGDFDAVEAGVGDLRRQLLVVVRSEELGEGTVFIASLGFTRGEHALRKRGGGHGGERAERELATVDGGHGNRHGQGS